MPRLPRVYKKNLAVAIRPAAGCLIQLLFNFSRIFRRLCLQLHIVEKKSAQVGFEPGTFIIVIQCLTHQTNLQHTRTEVRRFNLFKCNKTKSIPNPNPNVAWRRGKADCVPLTLGTTLGDVATEPTVRP